MEFFMVLNALFFCHVMLHCCGTLVDGLVDLYCISR